MFILSGTRQSLWYMMRAQHLDNRNCVYYTFTSKHPRVVSPMIEEYYDIPLVMCWYSPWKEQIFTGTTALVIAFWITAFWFILELVYIFACFSLFLRRLGGRLTCVAGREKINWQVPIALEFLRKEERVPAYGIVRNVDTILEKLSSVKMICCWLRLWTIPISDRTKCKFGNSLFTLKYQFY